TGATGAGSPATAGAARATGAGGPAAAGAAGARAAVVVVRVGARTAAAVDHGGRVERLVAEHGVGPDLRHQVAVHAHEVVAVDQRRRGRARQRDVGEVVGQHAVAQAVVLLVELRRRAPEAQVRLVLPDHGHEAAVLAFALGGPAAQHGVGQRAVAVHVQGENVGTQHPRVRGLDL